MSKSSTVAKVVNFGNFLKTQNLQFNSVTRQANFNRTKNWWKMPKSRHSNTIFLSYFQTIWSRLDQKVLPYMWLLIRQKLEENAKMPKFKCDIFELFSNKAQSGKIDNLFGSNSVTRHFLLIDFQIWIKMETVFENQRKSRIQQCERSELHIQFEWTKHR